MHFFRQRAGLFRTNLWQRFGKKSQLHSTVVRLITFHRLILCAQNYQMFLCPSEFKPPKKELMYVGKGFAKSFKNHGSRKTDMSNFTGLAISFFSSHVSSFSPSCHAASILFKAKKASKYRFVSCFLWP